MKLNWLNLAILRHDREVGFVVPEAVVTAVALLFCLQREYYCCLYSIDKGDEAFSGFEWSVYHVLFRLNPTNGLFSSGGENGIPATILWLMSSASPAMVHAFLSVHLFLPMA
ncbi:MAG: hypothetical protein E6Q97_10985 [Desulfurellales bacterium]|nr:MAG: hypothetical protein E6Q97_10985 [Desulfurellales bacterium]